MSIYTNNALDEAERKNGTRPETIIDIQTDKQEQITLQVLEDKNPTLGIKTEESKPIPTPPPLSQEAFTTSQIDFKSEIEAAEKTENLTPPSTLSPETHITDEKPQGFLSTLSSAANGTVDINENTSIKYGILKGVEFEHTF